MTLATRTEAAAESARPPTASGVVDAGPSPGAGRFAAAEHEGGGLAELDERRHRGTGRPKALMIMRRRTDSSEISGVDNGQEN